MYIDNQYIEEVGIILGHSDAIKDAIKDTVRDLSWDNIIFSMPYPIHVPPQDLWSYKYYYFMTYQQSYTYTMEICDNKRRVNNEFGQKYTLATLVYQYKFKYPNLFESELGKMISSFTS